MFESHPTFGRVIPSLEGTGFASIVDDVDRPWTWTGDLAGFAVEMLGEIGTGQLPDQYRARSSSLQWHKFGRFLSRLWSLKIVSLTVPMPNARVQRCVT